jgi:aspartate/methionine/tyrosine aminotransferase
MKPKLFKLEAIFEQFEHVSGMNVLGASDVETYSVGELLHLARGSVQLECIRLGYEDVKGRPSLRQAVADCYPDARLTEANILMTIGASEAILLALHASLKPNDKALVCHPAYQGLSEMAETAGAIVTRYDYLAQADFKPDLGAVRKFLEDSRPQVLLLNSPHNPTGQVLDREALVDLFRLAKDVGTRVIVDEVFHGIWIDHEPVPSAVSLDSDVVVISCLSKVYGLPGLRIGWLAGPADFIDECKLLRYYTSLAPPSVVQQLAEIALRNGAQLIDRGQKNVTQNYRLAIEWLDSHQESFDYIRPQGGTVMLLKLKANVDTKSFAEDLAEKRHVFLVPCSWAFEMEEGYLRLGLGGNPKLFAEGLAALDEYLSSRSLVR